MDPDDYSSHMFTTMIQEASNLEKIRWCPYVDDQDMETLDVVKDATEWIMTKCKSLKYLEILLPDIKDKFEPSLLPMMRSIEESLNMPSDIQRGTFKLRLYGDAGFLLAAHLFMQGVNRLARLLDGTTEDFMIIFKLRDVPIRWMDFCVFKIEKDFSVSKGDAGWWIITNEDCEICGYSESWMMNCSRDDQYCTLLGK